MNNHSTNTDIQEYGCRALLKFVENDNNEVMIAEQEGISTILSAMKRHSSNANVQESGCAALCILADNNENNKLRIAAAGGIIMILSAMKNHLFNANVQDARVWLCSTLELGCE